MLYPITMELNEAQVKRVINRLSHIFEDGMSWFYDYNDHCNKQVCLNYGDEQELYFYFEGEINSPKKIEVMKEIDLPMREVARISNAKILGEEVECPTFPFAEVMRAINSGDSYFTYCIWK